MPDLDLEGEEAQAVVDTLKEAMRQHDRIKRSTDIPLYYGIKGKDSISPINLLNRFEKAAELAGWNTDKKKVNEFYMLLRDDALIWWDTLGEKRSLDLKDWDSVKAEFLKYWEPKYSVKTTCANFVELTQRTGEDGKAYYLRVHQAFKRLIDSRPEETENVRVAPSGAEGAITQDDLDAAKMEGLKDADAFFKHQLFIAGLRSDLRAKVMEAGKNNIFDTLDVVIEQEIILADRRGPMKITSIKDDGDAEKNDIKVDEMDEEELAAVNAIRTRNGKPPFRRKGKANGGKASIKCRYCKKMGHMQKECRSRIRDGAPMVDFQGKVISRNVNAVTEESNSSAERTIQVGAIGGLTENPAYSLNW